MTRTRFVTLAPLALMLLTAGSALAVTGPKVGHGGRLELAHGAGARELRMTQWDRTPPRRLGAWLRFRAEVGSDWRAMWDASTDVPHRLYGKGISAPGVIAQRSSAEAHARAFLARHIDLLAPGSSVHDFQLITNRVDRGMRTVAFAQHWRGLRVLGGQLAFQYKNDRLFVISSQALPDVSADARALGGLSITKDQAQGVAVAWLRQDAAMSATPRGGLSAVQVLPIVRGTSIEYRTVVTAIVDTMRPVGEWKVYVDAVTGQAVARENDLRYGSGQVLYNTPRRRPTDVRQNYPAPNLTVGLTGGGSATSDESGLVAWGGDASIQVTLGVGGPLVGVSNQDGEPATRTLTLPNGGQVVWNESEDELLDAQLTAYIHAHVVKAYVRGFAGGLEWLDEKLPVVVNIDDDCNAFSDGNSINFFTSSANCENTGRLPDVVYHEFGHSLHSNSIIPGVGAFEGALSEGLSDYLAATITDDSGMGRGFFYDSSPLRELNPEGFEHKWPDDIGQIHYTGLIIGGALWDLRTALIADLGFEDGVALTDRLFYAAMQNATDIPSTYVAILAEDDDDGDLSNGTPNVCTINAQFGLHGLRKLVVDVGGLASQPPSVEGHPLSVELSGLFEQCAGDAITGAQLAYNRFGRPEEAVTLDLEVIDNDSFIGAIPDPEKPGVVEYRVILSFADGSVRSFPENPADPRYQFYVGETVELYCTDFETDPFSEGWTSALAAGDDREGANDWQWGSPAGTSGSGDPTGAYSGQYVLGNDLGGGEFNGTYQANKTNYALSPAIDIQRYSDVRLQYRRWLNVEDAFFDKATIFVDELRAWENFNSNKGNASTVHHRDSEWRFHDVALSPFITSNSVQLRFQIESDAGLEFGGWTIDDLCIVADANSLCGDGKLSGAEDCDDGPGNSNAVADSCRENCRAAGCGDGVRDSGEQCDDGNRQNGDGCDSSCQRESSGDCGLSVTGPSRTPGPGGLLVVLLGFAAVFALRRRAR